MPDCAKTSILVVCQHYYPEPFNVSFVCETLAQKGYDVTVLTGIPNYPQGEIYEGYRNGRRRRENLNGVEVIRASLVARGKDLVGLNKIRRVVNYVSFSLTASLNRAVRRKSYDCVVVFQFSPVFMAIPGLRIARAQHIPCMIYTFDLWPEDMLSGGIKKDGVIYSVIRWISGGIYKKADMLAVTSLKFRDYFQSNFGIGEDAVWLPQFAESMFEKSGSENSDPLSDRREQIVFTFAGNIAHNQSVETIVEAAALIQDERILIRIVGDGSCLENCKDIARGESVKNVVFYGRRSLEEMPEIYSSSDAMLLTLGSSDSGSLVSKYTLPRKLQSYMAARKPIIASVGDSAVADVIKAANCGIVCAAGNPVDLAHAIEGFAGLDVDRREDMASNARRYYDGYFSNDRFFEGLECTLANMIEKAA